MSVFSILPTNGRERIPTVTLTGGEKKQNDPKEPKEINRISELKKQYEIEAKEAGDNYGKLLQLAQDYKNKKLDVFKNLSKEEIQSQREFRADLTKDINEQVKKQFDGEIKALEENNKRKQEAINDQIKAIDNDAGLSDLDRIDKKIVLDNQLIELQKEFNNSVDGLEQKYKLTSEQNADERARALKLIQEQLGVDLVTQQMETFEKLQEDQQQALREIQQRTTNKIIGVLTNGALTPEQKKKQSKKIEEDAQKELYNLRLQQIDLELAADQKLLEQKLISQKEYNDRVADLEEERLRIHKDANERELDNEKIKNDLKEKLQDAAFQIAEKFVQSYIQGQLAEVEANYKASQDKLAIQKEQRLATAQSKAEEESIKREFEAKEKEAERKRNKERQAIARQQLALEWAVASIKALSTSTNIYEGLIKEAVVTAEYFAALSVLNKQQFAFSGKVKPERLTDGIINARPNVTPTAYGDNVLAYVKPGEVILNKQHQAMLGGDKTFARIGVPGFSSYGSSVQPPIFRSYISTGSNGNGYESDISEMKEMYRAMANIILSESSKPVVLNPNAVTKHQNNIARNVNLATV